MPSTPRTSRPGAGPGRGKPRPRSVARAEAPALEVAAEAVAQSADDDRPHGIGVTRRAVIMIAVMAFLLLSYAGSLRIYLDTERQNAENAQAIQRSHDRIDELNGKLRRWDDADFVRAQARERLGWVMPGETGYRVIGPDGRPVGTRIEPMPNEAPPAQRHWWQRMRDAMRTADLPVPSSTTVPTPTAASQRPPLTDGTRTPTPKKTPTPTKKAR